MSSNVFCLKNPKIAHQFVQKSHDVIIDMTELRNTSHMRTFPIPEKNVCHQNRKKREQTQLRIDLVVFPEDP